MSEVIKKMEQIGMNVNEQVQNYVKNQGRLPPRFLGSVEKTIYRAPQELLV